MHRFNLNSTIMSAAWILTLAGLLSPTTLAAHNQPDDVASEVTLYEGSEPPLRPNPDRIAILTQQRDTAVTVALALGLPEQAVSEMGYPGAFLIETSLLPGLSSKPLAERVAATHAATEGTNAFASPVFLGTHSGPVIPTTQIIARLNEQTLPDLNAQPRSLRTSPLAQLLQILSQLSIETRTIEPIEGLPRAFYITPTASHGLDVLDAANAIASHDELTYAEPVMIFTGHSAGDPGFDPGFDSGFTWGIQNTGQSIFGVTGVAGMDLNVIPAWNTSTGQGVHIAIIDTGVDPAHPDIRQAPGTDTTPDLGANNGATVNPCDNHGTPVAGSATAIRNNDIGTLGSAPDAISRSVRAFISVTACTGNWSSGTTETVNALLWIEAQGIRITNNSNCYGFESTAIRDAYRQTRDNGAVHFACSCNNGVATVSYPARLGPVIAVGAIENRGLRASFSNYGIQIALVAPGRGIYTTDRTGSNGWTSSDYTWATGTSFASPYVAGVAALVLQANPLLTSADVRSVLTSTARDLGPDGRDDEYGFGLVDAHAAVQEALLRACLADTNDDGILDLGDITAFVTLYLAGDLAADFNADNILDLGDISTFIQAFLAGC